MIAAVSAQQRVADFVAALVGVYTLVIIAWVVLTLVFSLGLSVPYSRVLNAVLDFLRDTAEPYLRIFRRLGLQIGPIDLSPMVAIIVLQVVGSLLVAVIAPG